MGVRCFYRLHGRGWGEEVEESRSFVLAAGVAPHHSFVRPARARVSRGAGERAAGPRWEGCRGRHLVLAVRFRYGCCCRSGLARHRCGGRRCAC